MQRNFSNRLVFDVDEEPWQIKLKDQKTLVRFSLEIRICDSETFSTVFKVFSHGGDICIIDDYFEVIVASA